MSHAPIWFARYPKGRRPSYAPLRNEHSARVVIVGGGLTGAACALTFAAAGIPAIVLEAEAIGGGLTAGEAGVVREGFAGSFQGAVAEHGLKTSRAVWDTMRRGALDFATALRRYKVRCDLAPGDVITFAGPGSEEGRLLRREY